MNNLRIGFVGLGAMGDPMARHLVHKGFLKFVYSRTYEKTQKFATELNVSIAQTLKELANNCNVIMLCVSADADVLAVTQEIVAHAKPGMVVVDHSTVSSETAKQAQTLMASQGGDFLDAPVSGGVEGAKNAALSIMVGGNADTLARVRPALDTYAARITHMGPIGSGQNTKAVNQVLIAGIAQAVCEGLALSEKLGLDPELLLPTLNAGAARNWFLEKRGTTMLHNEFSVGFKLALLYKDLVIVRKLAEKAGIDPMIIESSLAAYGELIKRGYGDEDISALIRLKRGKSLV